MVGKYNGYWTKGNDRVGVFMTVEDIIIHYRKVDKDGHKIGKKEIKYADEVLPGYTKDGSGRKFE